MLLSLCALLSSCVMDEEVLSETGYHSTIETKALVYHCTTNEDTDNQDIPEEAFSQVKFNIKNEIPNLYLIVENIQICKYKHLLIC